jgi:uncharacterized membrane protein YoaK (UPF0700 family)
MPLRRNPRTASIKLTVAVLLTIVAGQVDVAGFVICWKTFTAHMTGNTVHLAMSVVARHWTDAVKAGLVIPIFLFGSLIGRCLIEFAVRRRFKRAASLVLLLEAAALSEAVGFTVVSHSTAALWTSLMLLALGMGLQTATLTRIGPLTVHTTFVTGMLNSLAQRLSIVLFLLWDKFRGRTNTSPADSHALRQAGMLTLVWIAYFFGGVLGALLVTPFQMRSLFFSLMLLFAAIVVDQLSPLSIEEEQDQAKQESEEHLRRAG